jgi:O-antigen ligase
MHRAPPSSLVTTTAGVLAAAYLMVGRWGPGRLIGIDFKRYYELNGSMFVEVRHSIVLAFCLLTFLAEPPRCGRLHVEQSWALPRIDALFALIAGMYAYLLLSVTWAVNSDMALLKGYEVLLALAATWAIWRWATSAQAAPFCRAVWGALVCLTLPLAAVALRSAGGAGRLAVLGGGPNILGRLMCLLALGCLNLAKRKVFFLTVPVAAVVLIVMTGSRGAMLGAAGGLLTYILWDQSTLKKKVFLLGTLALATSSLILFTRLGDAVVKMYEFRVRYQTFQRGYTAGRSDIMEEAYERGASSPLGGTGLGGSVGVGGSEYPHNLFLELFCEGGIIAILFLTAALVVFAAGCWAYRDRCGARNVAAFIVVFIASQFSGDLYDSRAVFAFMLLTTVFDGPGRERSEGAETSSTVTYRASPVSVENELRDGEEL